MSAPFKIFQVSWLTQMPGNDGPRSKEIEHFYYVIKFLQDNDLVCQDLITDREDLTDEFALSSDNLTEDGLAVMKVAYDKWLTKVDNGMSPEDVTLLEKALKKVRG